MTTLQAILIFIAIVFAAGFIAVLGIAFNLRKAARLFRDPPDEPEQKEDPIGETVTVTVDRPLGSYHPEHKDLYYPVNYGYIEGVIAPDGEEQDAYILGVDRPVQEFTGRVIAVVHRRDDAEDKWVVCPEDLSFSKEEIAEQIAFQEQYFQSEIIM